MATFSSDSTTQTKPGEQLPYWGTVPEGEDITIGSADDGSVVVAMRILRDNSVVYHMFSPELALAMSWALRDAARVASMSRKVNKPEEES